MTAHPIDRDFKRIADLADTDPVALRNIAWQLVADLGRAEHRIARLEAQTAIRGRAVVMYRDRAREAEARIKAVQDLIDGWQVDGYDALLRRIRRALDGDA